MTDLLRRGAWADRERLTRYPLIVGAMSLAGLILLWMFGQTPTTDALGKPIGTDFSGVWTAGRMLLEGNVTGLFDPVQHFAYQQAFHANPKVEVYGWHYPPFFLAVAALVGSLPYLPALLFWQATTFAAFVAVLRSILPAEHGRLVTIAAFGFPATFVTFAHGHNAFLSAALIGGGLLLLERRPVLAGVLIGLLAYKPQFGLVLPLVLALGGHWRAFFAAGATVVAMAAATTLVLGTDVWIALFEGAKFTREVVLEQGATGWYKIQSLFSAARSFGAPLPLAYALQAILTLAVMASLALLVLRRADHRLIAAATAVAALLSTPYAMDYDMAILAVAIVFGVAHGLERGFAPYEISIYAATWAVPLVARAVMKGTGLPLGLLVMSILFAFLVRKAWGELRSDRPVKSFWRPALGSNT